jgi:Viral BACON domain
VQDDGPNFPRYDAPGRTPGGMPIWPEADARHQRSSGGVARPTALAAILAVSIGANVALIAALLSVVLLARAGFFSPSPQTGAGITATNSAQSSPSPSLSATATAGWLQVAPTSVQLGCDSGQQVQYVTLANTGTESVRWRVDLSVDSDQAGVSISPTRGTLRPGTSIAVQIQNRSQGDGQQGVIRFTPADSNAPAVGASPSLSYTTLGC